MSIQFSFCENTAVIASHFSYLKQGTFPLQSRHTINIQPSEGSSGPHDHMVVNLDRPFLYAIIDNATNLPIFIGALMTV